MVDPFSEVAGRGIEKLQAAEIDVEVGILEHECKELNKRFITFFTQKRPYIILKWAQTADGFIAPDTTKLTGEEFAIKRLITGDTEQVLVHKWRGEEQAILVGKNTALLDNPKLDTRAFEGKNPFRIVIDKEASLPQTLNVFSGLQHAIIFTSKQNVLKPNELTEYIFIDFNQNIWPQIFKILYEKNIQSVIIEGGLFTLQSIIKTNSWDEARVFTSTKTLAEGVKAPHIKGLLKEQTAINNSQLHIYTNA
jgi:diaminohydroxyphosphoribosylaminopyrimidine deaminase/5-amino-6-(5-phosphoribosylamino)uracil reductase